MPRPLMILFLSVGVAAIALIVILMVRPPRPSSLLLGERRSPPRGVVSHDVGRIVPAPIPSAHPPLPPACERFASVTIEGSIAAFDRVSAGLRSLCELTGASIPAELADALTGLDRISIRFAAFQRSGEEATTDLSARKLYLNTRFARSNTPTILVTPVLAHEGWHLAHASERLTARSEFRARTAELQACRLLIDKDKWIRNCDDAERIVSLGEDKAISLLQASGFPAE